MFFLCLSMLAIETSYVLLSILQPSFNDMQRIYNFYMLELPFSALAFDVMETTLRGAFHVIALVASII